MKKLYLDRNIFEDIRQKRPNSSCNFYNKILSYNNIFAIYASIIHAEEIYYAYTSSNDFKLLCDEINLIDKIVKNNIISPGFKKDYFVIGYRNIKEHVNVVKLHYNETEQAIQNDISKNLLCRREIIDLLFNDCEETLKSLNSISTDKILTNKLVLSKFNLYKYHYTKKSSFKNLQNDIDKFMYVVELISDFLDVIQYHAMKFDNKSIRARMFDIGHIIYASYCDYFITNDKKLIFKARSIYSNLKIDTKVCKPEEFFSEYPIN